MKNNKNTQPETLARYLTKTGRAISSPQANAMLGIKNLRATVSDLRKMGHNIERGTNKAGLTTYRITNV